MKNKTITSIIDRVLESSREEFNSDDVHVCGREKLENFISSSLTTAIEEVGNELIGSDSEELERGRLFKDCSCKYTASGVLMGICLACFKDQMYYMELGSNKLRKEQRKKLSTLLGKV